MTYIDQRFILKALQYNLQHATYEPLLGGQFYAAPFYPHIITKDTGSGKLKNLLQALGVFALSLPITAALSSTPLDGLEHVKLSNELKVASSGDEFALEIAKNYAQTLGVALNVQHFDDKQKSHHALLTGEVDILLDTDPKAQDNTQRQPIHCTQDDSAAFVFYDNARLAQHAKAYLCQPDTQKTSTTIARFYHYYPNDYSRHFFAKAMAQRLPPYQIAFENYAERYNHDWRLLVAVAYQESQLDPYAISPTGVQGLMMLTRDTAAAMGVANRTDPIQSIKGGAKYLDRLQTYFADLPANERLWFVLAGYNMGPNAVRNVQEKIRMQGKNPNRWVNFYDYLATHASDNSRYGQCLHYVTGVRYYLQELERL